MFPPAFAVRRVAAKQNPRDTYQFTILTDWGNFSVRENFAGGKRSIERLRDVQPLRIIQSARRARPLHDVAQDQAFFARSVRPRSFYEQRFAEVRQLRRAEQKIDHPQVLLRKELSGRQSHQVVGE